MNTRAPHCNNCGGDGMLFRKPQVVTGLAVGIRQRRNVLDIGETQPGDMQFSIDFKVLDASCDSTVRRVSRDDKFTATWYQPLDDGQILVRGAAALSDNARLINNVDDSEDRLWYEPASAIHCEDENGVVYNQNSDFELGS